MQNKKIDDNEFQKIYNANKKNVFNIAYSYMKSNEDAENIMQEVFIKFYLNPPKTKNNLSAWLIKVTRNLCLDTLRKRKKEKVSNFDFENNIGSFDNQAKDFDILTLIDKMPEKYSSVIRLFYYGELSVKQISDSLKISESNVKKRLERGRNILKEMIKELKWYEH